MDYLKLLERKPLTREQQWIKQEVLKYKEGAISFESLHALIQTTTHKETSKTAVDYHFFIPEGHLDTYIRWMFEKTEEEWQEFEYRNRIYGIQRKYDAKVYIKKQAVAELKIFPVEVLNSYLIFFTVNSMLKMMRLLIAAGADVNYRGNISSHKEISYEDGWTPLCKAVNYGLLASARLLLQSGADVNLKGHNGKCPLVAAYDCHYSTKRQKVGKLLLEYQPHIPDDYDEIKEWILELER